MVVLAVILLLLVAVVVVSALVAGDGPATLNLVGADIVTTERVLFLAGVVSTAVAGLALLLLFKGMQHARSRRAEMSRLREAAGESERGSRDDRGAVDPGRTRRDDEGDHFSTLPRE
jgi:hypothetical protein